MSEKYISAKEAAARLNIAEATLYSYVSRGLIRSEAVTARSRQRRYLAEDVDRLVERKAGRRNPEKSARDAARRALQWGAPVLESRLTLILDERLYYRGADAAELARTISFEECAALLWTGDLRAAARLFNQTESLNWEADDQLSTFARLTISLTLAAERDLRALDFNADRLAFTGARILLLLARTLSPIHVDSIAYRLARGWNPDWDDEAAVQAAHLINAALILCADHELNPSSFAARVVAATQATLYGVVSAGLAALQGIKHGGNTRLAVAFLKEVEANGSALAVIRERRQRGERIPGFGHVLYREHGDPRAAALLRLLRETYPDHPYLSVIEATVTAARSSIDRAPNIDFALAALERLLPLPPDSGISLFALGRTAGWIAHALEQYADGNLIRPRAVYTGIQPEV
ncbi:MAG: citrate synthase family protein [Anaerolinea sp.]|nr:citrate synthase family protein [Anaerolinea sp.]